MGSPVGALWWVNTVYRPNHHDTRTRDPTSRYLLTHHYTPAPDRTLYSSCSLVDRRIHRILSPSNGIGRKSSLRNDSSSSVSRKGATREEDEVSIALASNAVAGGIRPGQETGWGGGRVRKYCSIKVGVWGWYEKYGMFVGLVVHR